MGRTNKNTNLPLVSVIMPVYNAGEFLVEAIESIVNQTYPNFEFLIVDDRSTDNSREVIRKYQKKYPKLIKAYFLRKNINSAGNGAVNAVLKYAKGEYIARMDADDISYPRRIEEQVKFLEKNKDIILVGTQALVIDGNGKIIGRKLFPLSHKEIYKKYAVVHPIIHPSCMIRRSALEDKNRLYELKGGVNDDYFTFLKLLQRGKFANLPEILLKYRVHGKNTSLRKLKEKYFMISQIRKTAVKNFGYKISFKNKVIVALQDFVIALLPENILERFYFLTKGIKAENARLAL